MEPGAEIDFSSLSTYSVNDLLLMPIKLTSNVSHKEIIYRFVFPICRIMSVFAVSNVERTVMRAIKASSYGELLDQG